MMQIKTIQVYRGRNIYSHKLVIKMVLDLGEFYDTPTNKISGFNDKLLIYIPNLTEHKCASGEEHGFLKRLEEGTYLAHVAEHSILEIQNMLGFDVKYGKARVSDNERIYEVIYQYELEKAGILCGELVVELFNSIIEGRDIAFNERLAEIQKKIACSTMGPSTASIYKEAVYRGIPVMRVGDDSILQLGYGKFQKRVEATLTENASCVSVDISCDKELAKKILRDACLPVAEGSVVYDVDDAIGMAHTIGYPVVLKPRDGNQGKGVSVNINSDSELRGAYETASKYSRDVIVEKYIRGKDYRVLVIGDSVAAVSQRIPPFIIGDGVSTIKELVDAENRNPKRGFDHERQLTQIVIDDISRAYLIRRNLTEDSVLQNGEKLYLRENANLSTGGTAKDCTDIIHPLNIELAVRAARLIGLDVAGVDITTPDISKPIAETGGVIIEINAAPGIRMHLYPAEGKPRNVAKAIVDMLYPHGNKFSVPIVSVTGTNGKTTTTRMIAHILSLYGYNVGMTTTGGIYINNRCILKGDTTGPSSARTVLGEKSVEAAVLETARGGIVRSGLGYDLADVGIITNISEDHLGIDGINTIEDLAFVKSLVAEAVKDKGYAVLNADDGCTPYISKRVKSKIIYFSRSKDNIILKRHLKEGNTGVYISNGVICIGRGEEVTPVAGITDIPSTMEGRISYSIENSLAATAGCCGLNIPADTISMGLKTFYLNEAQNPGRFNIYNVGNFRVLVDYGHNAAGYRGVLEAAKKLGASRLVGVIGVPGDRSDESAVRIGKIAGEVLDYIYIKEDKDLRGRNSGEISKLLEFGVISSGKSRDSIEIILPETEALEAAMENGKPGDLIIIFYEKLDPVLEVIKRASESKEKVEKDIINGRAM
jgi:cyanophycin synthetase